MKLQPIISIALVCFLLNMEQSNSQIIEQATTPVIDPVDLNIGIASRTKSKTPVINDVLTDVVPGIRSTMISMDGGITYTHPSSSEEDAVFLILKGRGEIKTDGKPYKITTETIAHFPVGRSVTLKAGKKGLDFLILSLVLTPPDREDLAAHLDLNTVAYVKRFKDCEPYSEAIKSAKTVSRTLLPKDIVPRMAIGTVETTGPDKVGAHRHPMLEQYFLGLKDNYITVASDSDSTILGSGQIFHIPSGSNHGAEVTAGKKLYYIWMDFFQDREGLEWLNVHKPIVPAK